MQELTTKQAGRVYTPSYLVKNTLDLCGYTEGHDIINKHVIDNSCGDGAFLVEVADRFIRRAKAQGIPIDQIALMLTTYIHGIELDKVEAEKCKHNLTEVANQHGIDCTEWDIDIADSLTHTRHIGNMDYVVGNPPYVRIHNISLDTKQLKTNYSFVREGMADLYLAFFELGLYMLKDGGTLGFITPSSYFGSKSGGVFRDYIIRAGYLRTIVDLGHFLPFTATTYVAITVLTKDTQQDFVNYHTYDEINLVPSEARALEYSDFLTEDLQFLFGEAQTTLKILTTKGLPKICTVKNGMTTLLDEFFIADSFPFDENVITVLKASTGVFKRCIYPYNELGCLNSFDALQGNLGLFKRYTEYKDRLLKRDIRDKTKWYEFGRSQGIKDTYKDKYGINSLIRDTNDIKLVYCPAGTGVYSGLYITTVLSADELKEILHTDEFVNYVQSLGKYKSGGYYTYSAKELELYLNYKASQMGVD